MGIFDNSIWNSNRNVDLFGRPTGDKKGRIIPRYDFAQDWGLNESQYAQFMGDLPPYMGAFFQRDWEQTQQLNQDAIAERNKLTAQNDANFAAMVPQRDALLEAIHGQSAGLGAQYQPIIDELAKRSQPGYEFLGPSVRAGADLAIGQNVARDRAAHQASAAGRGTATGGGAMQRDVGDIAAGHSVRTMSNAYLDRENAAARERALGGQEQAIRSMNAGQQGYLGLEQQALNAQNQQDLANVMASLGIFQGTQTEPTDFMQYPAAAQANQQYNDYLQMAMQESGLGVDDIISLLVGLVGSRR